MIATPQSKKRRKLLFFSPYYYPYISGLTTYPKLLFADLSREYDITILTFRHDTNLSEVEYVDGCKVVRMPYMFKVSKGFISLQSLIYFLRGVSSADIILTNLPNVEGVFLALLARILHKSLVCLFHCEVLLGSRLFDRVIAQIIRFATYCQLLISDTQIGYTQDYVSSILPTYLLRHLRFRFIVPPIPYFKPDVLAKSKYLSEKSQSVWIGFAGRVSREKGLDILIDACAHVQNKFKKQVVLVMAGPYGSAVAGEKDYYDLVQRHIVKTGINVKFLGSLEKNSLASFYESIDVLVLPSTNKTEAFGMVQVEAMMHGIPVLASDMPGVRVPIQMTHMGILIDPGDVEDLATKLLKILANEHEYTDTKKVEFTRHQFGVGQAVTLWHNLLKSL